MMCVKGLACDGLKSLIETADVPFDAIVGVPYAALPYATVGSVIHIPDCSSSHSLFCVSKIFCSWCPIITQSR